MWRYLKQVLIAFDQLINALLGGWADESLSTPTDGRGKEFPAYRRRIGPR